MPALFSDSSDPTAWRSLRRRPAFLAAAVVTLGLGTGMTKAVFSLVNTVLIRPLPYPEADHLVTVLESSPAAGQRTHRVAPARLEDIAAAVLTLVMVSASAVAGPALRAARTAPLDALRAE